MTRVEAIIAQFQELTDSERQELFDWFDSHPEMVPLSAEFAEELRSRIDDFESGAVQPIEAEEVFEKIRVSLEGRRRGD